jgi:hypothetical protein
MGQLSKNGVRSVCYAAVFAAMAIAAMTSCRRVLNNAFEDDTATSGSDTENPNGSDDTDSDTSTDNDLDSDTESDSDTETSSDTDTDSVTDDDLPKLQLGEIDDVIMPIQTSRSIALTAISLVGGSALQFCLVEGPAFAAVETDHQASPATGVLLLDPGERDNGIYSLTIRVFDGGTCENPV